MRTGIVGLGLRAGNVLKMIMEDMPEMELVGYVDPDPCGLSIIEEHSNSLTQYLLVFYNNLLIYFHSQPMPSPQDS